MSETKKIPLITVVDIHGQIRTLSSPDDLGIINGLQPDLDLTILALDNLEKALINDGDVDPLLISGLEIGLVILANGTQSEASKNIIHDRILVPIASSGAFSVGVSAVHTFKSMWRKS